MSAFLILILILSVGVCIVTGIWMIVSAFRQSIVWGLVYLFVPFGGLAFIIVHWTVVKTAFLINCAAAVVLIITVFSTPEARDALGHTRRFAFLANHEDKAKELSGKLQEQRDLVEKLQGQYDSENAETTRQYKALTEKRKTLKASDATAVRSFNAEAAEYQKQNTRLSQTRHDLDAAMAEVSALLDQRAEMTKGKNKQVVMYSTSSCPGCRAAKDYFAQKGVNYRDVNLDTSMEGRREFQQLGGQGVPLILVGDRKMEGFNSQALDEMLQN